MLERGGEGEKCQAAIHHPKCNGYADNIDHFTPKCILKLFRIAPEDQDKNNLVPINIHCHRLKDASTPNRKKLLCGQLFNGNVVSLDDYRTFRDKYDLFYVSSPDGD